MVDILSAELVDTASPAGQPTTMPIMPFAGGGGGGGGGGGLQAIGSGMLAGGIATANPFLAIGGGVLALVEGIFGGILGKKREREAKYQDMELFNKQMRMYYNQIQAQAKETAMAREERMKDKTSARLEQKRMNQLNFLLNSATGMQQRRRETETRWA